MIDHGRGVMREASAQDRLNPLSPLWDFPTARVGQRAARWPSG